ncbi:MAG: hypothetical protein ACYCY7_12405 [Gallionella sp.]
MKKIIFAAALSALTLPAYADVTINGKVSTLGLGMEVAFPMAQSIDGRIGLNTYKYNLNKTSTSNGLSTDYNGDLNLSSLEALADWHPFAGSFRMSGGLIYNNNSLNMTARPTGGTVNVGGTTYPINTSGQYVNAAIEFKKVAPYLGIGWGRTPKNTGLSFTSDIGIMYQGSPKANVTTNIPNVTSADISQANSDLNSSMSSYKFYPVISIGVGYTF